MAKAKHQELSIEEKLEQALVPEDEQPYDVPCNWVWVYFSSVCIFENGYAFKSDDYEGSGIPLIRISNIYNGGIDISKCVYIQDKNIDERFVVSKGDLLIAMSGATTGKNGVYQLCTPAYLNQRVGNIKIRYQNVVYNKFRDYYIYDKNQEILNKAYGGAQPNISSTKIGEMLFPLPPLDEQQRIVERIESLFEKLDNAKELAQNALDTFETRKVAILHKAFTGELTAKWREDNGDSSYDVLKSIEMQRVSLCKSERDRINILNEFKSSLLENNQPKNWLFLKAFLICDFITKGETPTKFVSNKGEVPFLKVYNIRGNKIDFSYDPSFIPKDVHEHRMKRSKVFPNDVIMNIVGPPLQKVAIVTNEYSEWNINQAIAIFRPVKDVIPRYLYYCLLCEDTLKTVLVDTRGVVGQSNISLEQCRNLLIPVPPLMEQMEIVCILDRLFEQEDRAGELCDIIEKVDLMKKAILARAFRGELDTNDPNEESAIELLKEVLAKEQ